MAEHLFNIREAAEYLGIGERRLKEMVDSGKIPAYRIGGTFLRFKKSQLVLLKEALSGTKKSTESTPKAAQQPAAPVPADGVLDGVKDFFYFNDFYILSTLVIVAAVMLMVAT